MLILVFNVGGGYLDETKVFQNKGTADSDLRVQNMVSLRQASEQTLPEAPLVSMWSAAAEAC